MLNKNKITSVDNTVIDINKNILSLNCLSPLINGYPYLPYTASAIDYHSLHILMNDIIINNRVSIIEFGSGISTILIGRLCKLNNLKIKLYSIDDNEGWFFSMKQKIKDEKLEDYINIIYSPLDSISLPNHSLKWYSTEVLDKELNGKTFDMVITDGPMAYLKEIERSRFPALPYIKNKMRENYSIYLHDANRQGEQSIIRDWALILNRNEIIHTSKLAGFTIGSSYTITI